MLHSSVLQAKTGFPFLDNLRNLTPVSSLYLSRLKSPILQNLLLNKSTPLSWKPLCIMSSLVRCSDTTQREGIKVQHSDRLLAWDVHRYSSSFPSMHQKESNTDVVGPLVPTSDSPSHQAKPVLS